MTLNYKKKYLKYKLKYLKLKGGGDLTPPRRSAMKRTDTVEKNNPPDVKPDILANGAALLLAQVGQAGQAPPAQAPAQGPAQGPPPAPAQGPAQGPPPALAALAGQN